MKRFRLATLMLLVVIAALVAALFVQRDRASRRIAESEAAAATTWRAISERRVAENQVKRLTKRVNELESNAGKDH